MPKDIETIKNDAAVAQFRFALIAPVVQGRFIKMHRLLLITNASHRIH